MISNLIVYVIAIVVLICLLLFLYCHFENKKFKITEYEVNTDKIDKDYRFVVLSDLHNYSYGKNNRELMAAIQKISPDAVISAGDMIEGCVEAKGADDTVRFLREIAEKFPFYYGCGNHEEKLMWYQKKYPDKKIVFFEALAKEQEKLQNIDGINNGNLHRKNIMPMVNVKEDIDKNVMLYGLNLEKYYFHKFLLHPVAPEYLDELLGRPEPAKFNILIGHNPDQFDSYAKWGADLVLSGHIHGGMVCFPWGRGIISPQFTLFPKYDHGIFHKDGTTMVLGRGLGNHTVHVRIFNRAEIVVVNLRKKLETEQKN